jgi:hypothetical protein
MIQFNNLRKISTVPTAIQILSTELIEGEVGVEYFSKHLLIYVVNVRVQVREFGHTLGWLER